jgi:hypothetical protein
MTARTRTTWINALFVGLLVLGLGLTLAGTASAATTEETDERAATGQTEPYPVGDPSEVPPVPPDDGAGNAEAEGIVKDLGGCTAMSKAVEEVMWIMDQAYHAGDFEGWAKAYDLIGLIRWAGRIACGWK